MDGKKVVIPLRVSSGRVLELTGCSGSVMNLLGEVAEVRGYLCHPVPSVGLESDVAQTVSVINCRR